MGVSQDWGADDFDYWSPEPGGDGWQAAANDDDWFGWRSPSSSPYGSRPGMRRPSLAVLVLGTRCLTTQLLLLRGTKAMVAPALLLRARTPLLGTSLFAGDGRTCNKMRLRARRYIVMVLQAMEKVGCQAKACC